MGRALAGFFALTMYSGLDFNALTSWSLKFVGVVFFFTTLPLVFRWLVSHVTLSTFVNSFIRLCLLGCG